MEEYISREALKRIYMEKGIEKGKLKLSTAINELELLPAADVAPVRHGRWEIIEDDILSDTWIKCSACGNEHETAYEQDLSCYPYCPNCGAKMDLED